jgi:hypothetical protein
MGWFKATAPHAHQVGRRCHPSPRRRISSSPTAPPSAPVLVTSGAMPSSASPSVGWAYGSSRSRCVMSRAYPVAWDLQRRASDCLSYSSAGSPGTPRSSGYSVSESGASGASLSPGDASWMLGGRVGGSIVALCVGLVAHGTFRNSRVKTTPTRRVKTAYPAAAGVSGGVGLPIEPLVGGVRIMQVVAGYPRGHDDVRLEADGGTARTRRAGSPGRGS